MLFYQIIKEYLNMLVEIEIPFINIEQLSEIIQLHNHGFFSHPMYHASTGPPQMTPGNVTFNQDSTTLTWNETAEVSWLNISYTCTVRYPNGHNYTTNVTNGTTSEHYDLSDMNVSGNITFEVQAFNCAGVGPKGYYTTVWNPDKGA